MESTHSQTPDHPQQAAKLPGAFTLFGPSWGAFSLNLGPFILGAIVPLIVALVPLIILLASLTSSTTATGQPSNISHPFAISAIVLIGVISLFSVLLFAPYMYVLKLQSAKGVKTSFRANFELTMHYLWRLFGLYLLRGLIILIGFVLLIVPGFIMWRRYMLAPFYLIDEDCGVFEALEKSARDSKAFSSAIWGMMAVYILLSFLGVIPLLGAIVGGVLSIIYCCAQALRYLQIKAAK